MNARLVVRLIGSVLAVEGLLMFLPLIVSLYYGGADYPAILISIAIVLAAGLLLGCVRAKSELLRPREGLAVVAASWVLVSAFGALPFVIHGSIPSFVDAFFETVSGFTTTGSTVLQDVEAVPRGLLFWRSFTHWAGGMGVLVLSLALIPKMGARSIHLMRAESPGPSPDRLVPRVAKTAKILYKIYLGMSALLVVALMLCGLDWFDALTHMFSTAGTGGFSTYNQSVGHFQNLAVEMVLGVSMVAFGVNFSIYYLLILGHFRGFFKNSELRTFVSIVAAATVLIALNILPGYGNFFTALRYSFFQVTTLISTTGFATADFAVWPVFSRAVIVFLMFVGSCAGSTAGGIKVVRAQLLWKNLRRDIHQSIHPNAVRVIKLDGKPVDEKIMSGVTGFFYAYMLITMLATIVVSLDGHSLETSFSAVLTTISNVGPGLGQVGPKGNFSIFSDLSKITLSMCMLLGRLEIFPILMLFTPSAWRK